MTQAAGDRSLPALFDAVLSEEPDLTSLAQDGETTSFGAWWADSSRIAGGLASRGVGPGDMLVLMLPSGHDFASAYLAALRLGSVVSAINPRLGPAEITHILGKCQPRAVVTDTPGRLEPIAGPGTTVLTPALARVSADRDVPGWADSVVAGTTGPAAVVWTTGSTGMPKGAWFDHGTLAFIGANLGPLSARHDRKLMPVPFAHTAYVTRVYDQLLHRSAYILTPPEWSAESMRDILVGERITLGQGVPTQWEKLLMLPGIDDADLSHLRIVSTGAARVPATLVHTLRDRLGVPVVVRYASTEVPVGFGTRVEDPVETVANSVGRPLGGAEISIRDSLGQPAEDGETGRVHIRSRARMRGYWRDPEQTRNTISDDGWVASSDLGRLDADGNLVIVGRADDAYIRGGYNVYPSEVEACLSGHPGVARVAVVGTPAPVIGEIGVAFVVPAPGTRPGEKELKAWCRERIADYKTPDHVRIVDDLPVNATFKVDTGRLRQMAAQHARSAAV
ncbi:MAG: AMP-binding protein [Streptosporangiales bacterium]|nr:AMP-binding protein [Streptosporangiales bacterium]